jgi:hypothetical protein
VCGTGESEAVVRRVIALVHRDLTTGRRGFRDTMTVLKQLRAFLKLSRDMNEEVKRLGVDVALALPGTPEAAVAEQRVRAWLAQHA